MASSAPWQAQDSLCGQRGWKTLRQCCKGITYRTQEVSYCKKGSVCARNHSHSFYDRPQPGPEQAD